MSHNRPSRAMRKAVFGSAIGGSLVLLALTLGAQKRSAGPKSVPYPEGYRSWTHVKTAILHPGHPLYEAFGGIHHVYANEKAAAVLRRGGNRFPMAPSWSLTSWKPQPRTMPPAKERGRFWP